MSGAHLSKDFFELVKAIGESKSKQEEDRIIVHEVKTLKQRLGEKQTSGASQQHCASCVFFTAAVPPRGAVVAWGTPKADATRVCQHCPTCVLICPTNPSRVLVGLAAFAGSPTLAAACCLACACCSPACVRASLPARLCACRPVNEMPMHRAAFSSSPPVPLGLAEEDEGVFGSYHLR